MFNPELISVEQAMKTLAKLAKVAEVRELTPSEVKTWRIMYGVYQARHV